MFYNFPELPYVLKKTQAPKLKPQKFCSLDEIFQGTGSYA